MDQAVQGSPRHPSQGIYAEVVDVGFGLTPAGSIGDFIFLDANGDGKQTGDKGISEVTVELIQDEKVIATTVTKEDWLYTLDKSWAIAVGQAVVVEAWVICLD